MSGSFQLSYCYHGKQHCDRGYTWGPGIKEQFKILFIHEGKGRYEANGRTHALGKGQGFIVYAHQVCMMIADELDPWVYSWIAFDGDYAESLLREAGFSKEDPVFSSFPSSWFDAYLNELDAAASNPSRRDLDNHSILYRLLADWTAIIREVRQPHRLHSSKESYVRQSLDFIHMNYCTKVSIAELARKIGIDRVYLSILFKDATNVSPQKYLLEYRMNKACALLGQEQLSISDVSHSVGYPDPLLFSRMFKKVIGQSPSTYRSSLFSSLLPTSQKEACPL